MPTCPVQVSQVTLKPLSPNTLYGKGDKTLKRSSQRQAAADAGFDEATGDPGDGEDVLPEERVDAYSKAFISLIGFRAWREGLEMVQSVRLSCLLFRALGSRFYCLGVAIAS